MKEKAIDCISELIYQSTWKQTAYDNRLKGFIAEALAPSELVETKGYKSFKGGWILPLQAKSRFRDTEKTLYLTILDKGDYIENWQKYSEIYRELNKFEYKYLAVYEIDFEDTMKLSEQFSALEFPKINIEYFKYVTDSKSFVNANYDEIRKLNRKEPLNWQKPNTKGIDRSYKKVLEKLSRKNIYEILADRYIFDYLFGHLFFNKGIPADFDMIVNFPDREKKYVIYEIKEKDPSKKNTNTKNVVGFGMDIDRINDYKTFIEWFPAFDFRYLVREIDNQKNRNFVNWRSIDMKKFIDIATFDPEGKSGGKGMLPGAVGSSYVPTSICPLKEFKII